MRLLFELQLFKKKKILDLESQKSFKFFWEEANTDKNSPGFGLIKDRSPSNPDVCSIASVGFGLTAITIGVERHWITYKEAYDRVLGTLDTLINNAEQINGFFYHFLDMNTAKRTRNSEISIIDTAILINGAITVGEYFGGIIKEKAEQIYKRVNWKWYLNPRTNHFYMGYSPEKGFFGAWDWYAEQFMVYFLAAASPTFPVNAEVFYDFERAWGAYGYYPPIVHTWTGSLFTYQYSFAWFDMRNKIDKEGVNWWENSIIASKSNRQFCIDYSDIYKTFGENSWGLTACDGPNGYKGGYGAPPSGYDNRQNFVDGTVPPAGAAGSVIFTPEESIEALNNYYKNHKKLWGKYGFKDAYNLDVSPEWYAEDVIGIDKGITLLMIENYRTGFVWKTFMKNKYIQSGMKKVGFVDIASKIIDDFEGNSISTGWKDRGNNVYQIHIVDNMANTGVYCLKVEYKKTEVKDAYFYTNIKEIDLDYMDSFVFSIYGRVKLKISFIDNKGNKISEKIFKATNKNGWKTYEWDISSIKNKLAQLTEIRIGVEPGDINASEIFYLDDIEFRTNKPIAQSVLIDGKPIVGNILKGNYVYYSCKGVKEGNSIYRWLISSSPDGEFIPIPGANSLTYKLKPEDSGKYIKFEVIPRTKGIFGILGSISGQAVQSAAIGEITEGKVALARNN